MGATDITGTTETAGVVGGGGGAKNTQDRAFDATKGPLNSDGTEMRVAGGSPASTGPGNYNPPPVPATPLDTEAVYGGTNRLQKDDPTQYMTGTLDTTLSGGPIVQANPAYRAASLAPSASNMDTTWTDRPISDGRTRPDLNQTMTGTLDTVNQRVVLQTTQNTKPADATVAPTVAVVGRNVDVTVTALSDPAGAALRGYRVENDRGGVDFLERNQTTIRIGNLDASVPYKFRYAAVNDNGIGKFSPYSAAATPLLPERPLYKFDGTKVAGAPTGLDPANTVNRVYNPDGTYKAGSGTGTGAGTTYPIGAVGSPAAATGALAGELNVTWTAPTYGSALSYTLVASAPAGATISAPAGSTSAKFTGLTAVSRTVTITPVSASGNGPTVTTNAATAHV